MTAEYKQQNFFDKFELPKPSKAPENVADRSQLAKSQAFANFMQTGWDAPKQKFFQGFSKSLYFPLNESAYKYAAKRREKLTEIFPEKTLVISAGEPKDRANDMFYGFRPDTAFIYLTALTNDFDPYAKLVLKDDSAILYIQPSFDQNTTEFFSSSEFGEFWIGDRPKLADFAEITKIETRPLEDFSKDISGIDKEDLLTILGIDSAVDKIVDTKSTQHQILAQTVSELRLVKDPYEIEQILKACEYTSLAFNEVVAALPHYAIKRGERALEGVFTSNARYFGNDKGCDPISASGKDATYMHWMRNTGDVNMGDLYLIDTGVEVDSLYTSDITRVIPVNGKFSPIQKKIYEAVLDAADQVFEICKAGIKYSKMHEKAMEVIASHLYEWGILKEPYNPKADLQPHRRYMPHGTGHHLGLDMHDCALSRKSMYSEGEILPGMVFTIEPGLYFREDDLTVPEEFRGIGIRIEDDILVTPDGPVRLSEMIPRKVKDVELWYQRYNQPKKGNNEQ